MGRGGAKRGRDGVWIEVKGWEVVRKVECFKAVGEIGCDA